MYLPRDKYGRLLIKDDSLPDHVEVDAKGMRVIGKKSKRCSLKSAVIRKNMQLGKTRKEAEAVWERYQAANPKMGKGGLQRRKGDNDAVSTTPP